MGDAGRTSQTIRVDSVEMSRRSDHVGPADETRRSGIAQQAVPQAGSRPSDHTSGQKVTIAGSRPNLLTPWQPSVRLKQGPGPACRATGLDSDSVRFTQQILVDDGECGAARRAGRFRRQQLAGHGDFHSGREFVGGG